MDTEKSSSLFPDDGSEPKLILKRDFAALMGVTPGRISQLIHRGLPCTATGMIDPEQGKAWWQENIAGGRKRRDGAQGTLASTKASIDAERLEQLRLDTAERRGDLVRRDLVRRAIVDRGRAERDAHQAWVMRTAPVLAAELGVDGHRMFILLDAAMRDHLEFLARTPLEELLGEAEPLAS